MLLEMSDHLVSMLSISYRNEKPLPGFIWKKDNFPKNVHLSPDFSGKKTIFLQMYIDASNLVKYFPMVTQG